ncbi:hypothetical protein Acy02nite_40260 [Actinoplanes cyaneus]|uniref:Lipoprotein n=1 Tax=Actinoplanes cyaneus TaxID=52696 RepID=A0A919IQ98_9ACTN|nr:hypothetical protein [Actinoplanes cyaneus]MCW2139613.1 hypothetical protein [Actinoplanes cyaneus]GID66145.1 hypothetical protein Acy02nite_40260 [Actinoplanes cyaneus]
MKRFLAGALAGGVTLTLAVGCAKQIEQLEPKLEIKKAAEALGATGKAGFTLKAGGSVDDLIALAKKDAGTGADAFTDEDADMLRKLYNSSFTIGWDKGGDGVTDDRGSISAVIDGVTGVDLRVIDQVAYVKAPVAELAAKFGASKADVDGMRKELGSSIDGLDTLVDGGWVSVAMTDLQKMSGAAGAGVTPSADAAQNEKVAAELKASAQSLIEGADVVRDEKDKTHLTATTSTTKAYEQGKRLVESLSKIGGESTSGMVGKTLGSELDKPPADKPIVLDLWIDNGQFKAFEINLLQFAEGGTGRASLRVEVTSGVDIAAPTGAKKVDLSKLAESLGASGPGTGAAAGGAEEWADLIGSQAMLLAMTKGGKPASHLKEAVAKMTLPGVSAKVVRSGVAQVTSGTSVACVTLPASADGDPKVVAHAC